MEPGAGRQGRRAIRGKSVVGRGNAWNMACLISFKGGKQGVGLRVQDWQASPRRSFSPFIISRGTIVKGNLNHGADEPQNPQVTPAQYVEKNHETVLLSLLRRVNHDIKSPKPPGPRLLQAPACGAALQVRYGSPP